MPGVEAALDADPFRTVRAMRAPAEAVVFDFYFTLVDPQVHAAGAVEELLRRHGSPLAAEEVMAAWSSLEVPDLGRAFDGELPVFESIGDRWRAHGARLLETLGLPAEGNGWADARHEAHRRAEAYDDVAACLAELRRQGLRVAVLSDADNEHILPCIAASGLDFDDVLTSEDLRCYKPHRSLFETICSRVGSAVDAAIYVGDSPTSDVVGSRNAGMKSAWINRRGLAWPGEHERADVEIDTLLDLPRAVLDLGGARPL